MDLNDDELMVLTAAGVTEAFDMLFERWRHRVWAFARIWRQNRLEAEDVVQEVFLRVYRGARGYRPQGTFSAWLFTVAAHYIRTRSGLDARQQASLEEDSRPGISLENEERRHILRDSLERALEELSPRQRSVLLLRHVEGLDCNGIAGIMDMSSEQVRVMLHRSRKRLKTLMSDEEVSNRG